MIFRKAVKHDKETIWKIYQQVKGQEFCLWNEFYPMKEDIDGDLANDSLYVLSDEGNIVGCISIICDNELNSLDCWKEKNGVEISRVAVRREYQGHGYAKIMVQEAEKLLAESRPQAIHLLAGISNVPACRTYDRLGYAVKGTVTMYEGTYYAYEKILPVCLKTEN